MALERLLYDLGGDVELVGVDAEGLLGLLGDAGSDAAAATGKLSNWHGSRAPGTCPPGLEMPESLLELPRTSCSPATRRCSRGTSAWRGTAAGSAAGTVGGASPAWLQAAKAGLAPLDCPKVPF